MFDLVKLHLKAGNGGNGRVSFHREKFIAKGGPDGGSGGNGGSIIVRGSAHLNTLQQYAGAKSFVAKAGEGGGARKQIGAKSDDVILEVPIGTTIWILAENATSRRRRQHQLREGSPRWQPRLRKFYFEKPQGMPPVLPPEELQTVQLATAEVNQAVSENEMEPSAADANAIWRSASIKNLDLSAMTKLRLVEITADGQEVVICQGGQGGRGNIYFKAADNTTPFEAEYGSSGEEKVVLFELRLLADVGLVGFPNAGKSTFLSVVTKANPKIASYPFTTLEPQLGVMSAAAFAESNNPQDRRDIVLADLPGLIEGANLGKGLGFDFLRHIQGCRILLYMLTLEESVVFDDQKSDEEKAQLLFDQLTALQHELVLYDQTFLIKPALIALSKSDLFPTALIEKAKTIFASKGLSVFPISTLTHDGLSELQRQLATLLIQTDTASKT